MAKEKKSRKKPTVKVNDLAAKKDPKGGYLVIKLTDTQISGVQTSGGTTTNKS